MQYVVANFSISRWFFYLFSKVLVVGSSQQNHLCRNNYCHNTELLLISQYKQSINTLGHMYVYKHLSIQSQGSSNIRHFLIHSFASYLCCPLSADRWAFDPLMTYSQSPLFLVLKICEIFLLNKWNRADMLYKSKRVVASLSLCA